MTRDGVDWQHCWSNYLLLVRIADGDATASAAQIEQRTGKNYDFNEIVFFYGIHCLRDAVAVGRADNFKTCAANIIQVYQPKIVKA